MTRKIEREARLIDIIEFMHKTLTQFTKEILTVYKDYQKTGTKKWTYEIASRDLSYQVGVLNKLVLQLRNERSRGNLSRKDLKEQMADELADILAEIVFIAYDLGINLEKAWGKMLRSDREKIMAGKKT